MYDVGLSSSLEWENHYVAVAVLWPRHNKPNCYTRGMCYTDLRSLCTSIIIVHNPNEIKCINAACYRAIEQLIIKNLVPKGMHPDVKLLRNTCRHSKNILLETVKYRNHWLITAANRVLAECTDGVL